MTAAESSSSSQQPSSSQLATNSAAPGPRDPPRAHVQDADEQEQLYFTRWWLVASAFPMIAGTLGPVASAYSICALAIKWRKHMPPGTAIDATSSVPDPPWLTAINAIQLAMALVSNIVLLLHMARRINFSIAQPITIIGWYISSFCLISLCATAAGPLRRGLHPINDYVLSEAFYYGLWAAILYFFVASFMMITFWGASAGHFTKSFALTNSQRTLMLQTILFLSYLLIGALVFSTIEGWNYLDGVYWANVTLFTVGFGDYSPEKTLARALLIPYALVGIISLGLVISSIRGMILDRARSRVGLRMEEKTRRKLIRNLTNTFNDGILKPMTPQDNALSPHVTNEFQRRKVEFELMRDIQDRALARRRWMDLAVSTGTLLVLWLVGAVVFWNTEKNYQPGWDYFDSFYLCFISLTTIGFGDLSPVSNAGKAFFVFWSMLALPTMTVLTSHAEDTVVKFIKEVTIKLGAITILPRDKILAEMENVRLRKNIGRQSASTPTWRSLISQNSHNNNAQSSPLSKRTTAPRPPTRAARRFIAKMRHAAAGGGIATYDGANSTHHALDDLPTGREFQLLLVSEIQAVTQHLREDKPRRYSFEEWAWFLWLLGEDERDAGSHRMARPDEKRSRRAVSADKLHILLMQRDDPRADKSLLQWSWVGKMSPLTADQEESEWVLDCLTLRLKQALEEDV